MTGSRATAYVARGKRSKARFAPQPARVSGVIRRSTAAWYASRFSARPASTSSAASATSFAE